MTLAVLSFFILSIFALYMTRQHDLAKLKEELKMLEIQQAAIMFRANLVQVHTSEEHIYKIVPTRETMIILDRWKEKAELGEIDWPEATEPLDLYKLNEQYYDIRENKWSSGVESAMHYIESGYE